MCLEVNQKKIKCKNWHLMLKFLFHSSFRRKLLAEMVEDEQVAMEIARLEEEFRRLTEENRTLVTVHNERAQQLERLCVTTRTRQDSSWPLTSMEPEASKHPADARPGNQAEIKAQLVLHNCSQWIS